MKRLTLLIILFFSLTSLKAQSAEETLEWLNVKKIDVSLSSTNSNTVKFADQLEMTTDLIKVSSKDGAWTAAKWNTIKEVKVYNSYDIQIVFALTYEEKPLYINLRVYDNELKNKFIKAIKHMATLKGAKMIDSDLF